MRKQDLEAFARKTIAQVIAGNTVEDSGVELKAAWIEAEKAARRLAAHANAARGEPIVWLMGVDEKGKKVAGVEANEMSNWISKLTKQFDGEPPALTCQANIHYPEGTIVALCFETSMSPFVVKNPKGGFPEMEVPYRRGNDTRSANRADLLRILLPKLKLPVVQLFNTKLNVLVTRNFQGNREMPLIDKFDWTFTTDLYLTPRSKEPVVIPHINCGFRFVVSDFPEQNYLLPIVFKPIGKSLTVKYSASEIIIEGPGSVGLEAKICVGFDSRLKTPVPSGTAEIGIELKPVYADEKLLVRRRMTYREEIRGLFEKLVFSESNTWE